jgi:hypothetical protein
LTGRNRVNYNIGYQQPSRPLHQNVMNLVPKKEIGKEAQDKHINKQFKILFILYSIETKLPEPDTSKLPSTTWQSSDCDVDSWFILFNPFGFRITGIAHRKLSRAISLPR